MNDSKNILIGAAWPYANGSLHLGHVSSLIGGDLLARVGVASGDTLIAVNGHAVSSEAEVRAAWRSRRGGRVELVLVRAGHRDEETLSLALPETAIYVVPAGALAPCAR